MPLDYLNLNFSHMNSTDKEHTIYPSFSCNILSYPYLLLYIDEIDGTLRAVGTIKVICTIDCTQRF